MISIYYIDNIFKDPDLCDIVIKQDNKTDTNK